MQSTPNLRNKEHTKIKNQAAERMPERFEDDEREGNRFFWTWKYGNADLPGNGKVWIQSAPSVFQAGKNSRKGGCNQGNARTGRNSRRISGRNDSAV